MDFNEICQEAFRMARDACENGAINGQLTWNATAMINEAAHLLASLGVPYEEARLYVFPE